ncbi:MAG TPA: insulinase family protein, partial [Pyrinomonadaceae bacterium]|nr:insulinase family protein [Pyrinomonadaceae bacterium]
MPNVKSFSLIGALIRTLFVLALTAAAALAQPQTATPTPTPDFQGVIARQATLVTEFDVNGLKVIVKKREGSATVAAGLFIRGGVENITASNAGVESLMLSVASEASASYPRDRMRRDLARLGTVIGSSSNYDYSVLSLASTRTNFDRSWDIFTDV